MGSNPIQLRLTWLPSYLNKNNPEVEKKCHNVDITDFRESGNSTETAVFSPRVTINYYSVLIIMILIKGVTSHISELAFYQRDRRNFIFHKNETLNIFRNTFSKMAKFLSFFLQSTILKISSRNYNFLDSLDIYMCIRQTEKNQGTFIFIIHLII